jgi:hypothetical protein
MLHNKKIFVGENDTVGLYAQLDYFNDICRTFNVNAFTYDEIKLKMFSQILFKKDAHLVQKLCPHKQLTPKRTYHLRLVSLMPKDKIRWSKTYAHQFQEYTW